MFHLLPFSFCTGHWFSTSQPKLNLSAKIRNYLPSKYFLPIYLSQSDCCPRKFYDDPVEFTHISVRIFFLTVPLMFRRLFHDKVLSFVKNAEPFIHSFHSLPHIFSTFVLFVYISTSCHYHRQEYCSVWLK